MDINNELRAEIEATLDQGLSVSIEEVADGVAKDEMEHVIYGKIADFAQLQKSAGMEKQEQWEIKLPKTAKNATSGTMRVRLTQVEGQPDEYVFTTKTPMPDGTSKVETPLPSSVAHFLQFRMMAESGMRKDRFHFPVEGTDLVWEVDVFPKADGTYHDICKIDLEVSDLSAALPPLPIDIIDPISAPYGKRTPEEEALVTMWYDTIFRMKNQYLEDNGLPTPDQMVNKDTEGNATTSAADQAQKDREAAVAAGQDPDADPNGQPGEDDGTPASAGAEAPAVEEPPKEPEAGAEPTGTEEPKTGEETPEPGAEGGEPKQTEEEGAGAA